MMTVVELFFSLFSFMLIASSTMVVLARNPVHSVVFLILAFFNSAGLFVLLGAEFIAMIIVIVYVGAVAVLFLFVVMMLDINFAQMRKNFQEYLPFGFLVGAILCIEIAAMIMGYKANINVMAFANYVHEEADNTVALGRVLYTTYIYYFQIAGLILLVAMISAIVLTLRHRPGVKRQDPAKQSLRTVEQSIEVKQIEPGKGML